MSFGSAFGAFGSGAIDGYNAQTTANNKQDDRTQEQEIANAYGNTLASVFGGQVQQPQAAPSLFEKIGTGFNNIFGGGDQGGQPPQPLPAQTPGLINPAAMQQPQGPTTSMFQQQAPLPPSQGAQPQPGMPQGQLPPAEQARAPAQPQAPAMPVKLPEPNSLTWQQIVQRVQASNPNASPAVIAGVADRFRPFMTDQAKMQWQQMQLEMKGAQLDLRQQGLDQQGALRTRALDQADTKIQDNKGYRDARLGQMDKQEEGRNARAGQAEEGRNSRFDTGEAGKNDRFTQNQARLENALQTRVAQAQARLDQAKTISDRANAVREYEQAYKEYRDAASAQLNVGRSMLMGKEKEAAQQRIQSNIQSGMQKLDDLKRRLAGGGNPQGTPGSPYGGLGAPAPASYPDRDADQGQIERSGPVQQGRRDVQGKTSNRAPTASAAPPPSAAPTASAQPPAEAAPPPQAFEGLAPGQGRKFSNGQIWKLENGQPVRVQ